MKFIPQVALCAAAVMLGTGNDAIIASQNPDGTDDMITWSVSPGRYKGDAPLITFRYGESDIFFTIDDQRADLESLRAALNDPGVKNVRFDLKREPGSVTCTGRMKGVFDAQGSCKFVANAAFEYELRSRNLSPEQKSDLIAMSLFGVDLAFVDGLIKAGVVPGSINDVIAASALNVTPEYVAGLAAAGIPITSIEDAIACRALQIDQAYIRDIAASGLMPTASELIAMKATGVTSEFAVQLSAALQN